MLHALVSGLAGIEDHSKQFRNIRIAPRWLAAGTNKARVRLVYPSSSVSIEYDYEYQDNRLKLEIKTLDSQAAIHILIPQDKDAARVEINGKPIEFSFEIVRDSKYINFPAHIIERTLIEVHFEL